MPQDSVPPRYKTKEETNDAFLRYFERLSRANGWSEAMKCDIFPTLIESDSVIHSRLAELSEEDQEKWPCVKAAIAGADAPYRDGYLVSLWQMEMKSGEQPEKLKERIEEMVDKLYGSFTSQVKQLIARDAFILALPEATRANVLHRAPAKLADAVNAAMISLSLEEKKSKNVKAKKTCYKCDEEGHIAKNCPN